MSLINDMDFICGALFPFGGEAYDKAMAARGKVAEMYELVRDISESTHVTGNMFAKAEAIVSVCK
jgi:hypothetical protein